VRCRRSGQVEIVNAQAENVARRSRSGRIRRDGRRRGRVAGTSGRQIDTGHRQPVHRRLDDVDIYFLDNRNDRDESVDATFRVTGKVPEL